MPDHKNKKFSAIKKPIKKIKDPVHELMHKPIKDYSGHYVTPGYDPKKADKYEANRMRAQQRQDSKELEKSAEMRQKNPINMGSPLYGKISGPCKAAAKKKFKVWPSAYASGWGVRCTKAGGPSKFGGGKKKK